MSKERPPTFREMYGKETELDGEGVAISVSKTVGFTPTGELKDANCLERRGAKKSYNGCCPASGVK